jgi:hypothetical protein
MVKLAIQKGAIKLDNALRDACYYGYTNIAKYLIDNGGIAQCRISSA